MNYKKLTVSNIKKLIISDRELKELKDSYSPYWYKDSKLKLIKSSIQDLRENELITNGQYNQLDNWHHNLKDRYL